MTAMRFVAVAVTAMLAANGLEAAKPKVEVEFAFDATATMYLTDQDLGEAGRNSVAAAARAAFIAEAKKTAYYPFVDWVNGQDELSHRVTITVTQEPVSRDQQVNLEYRGRINKKDAGVHSKFVLFKWTDGKYANDADVLKVKVADAIRASVEGLRQTFIETVPIAGNAELDPNEHEVVIPFSAAALQADKEKVRLIVHFKPKGEAASSTKEMKLHTPAEKGSQTVACRIDDLVFRDLRLDRTNDWSPRLPEMFSPQTVDIFAVTVKDYQYKAYVSLTDD